MANTYVDPNFDVNASATVADLTTLKGSAPDADDKIYVYNGATLTVESALTCLLISLGETSAGAATDGQRRGNLTVNAGVTITFTGNATATNSGIKSAPASAPGTANESKSNTLTINGTAANPVIFTNAGGAWSATQRHKVHFYYGIIAAWDNLEIRYPSTGNVDPCVDLGLNDVYTVSTSRVLGVWKVVCGDLGANEIILRPRYAASLPLNYGRFTIDASGVVTADGRMIALFTHNSNPTHSIEGSLYIIPSATKYYYLRWLGDHRSAANAPFYTNHARGSFTADIRPNVTAPTGLAIADLGNGKGGLATITNSGSYAATDILRVYASDGTTVIGCGTFAEYTANSGIICGNVTLGSARTGDKCRATSDNYVYSDFQGAVNWTPTKRTVPAVGKVMADAGQFGDLGTELTPTLPLASVIPSAGGTADLPAIGNVRDTDTLLTVTGTLLSTKMLKSNATGDGAGSYNDDNLADGNVRPVAYGVGHTGDLANLVATDAAYAALEATSGRNQVPDLAKIPAVAGGGPAAWNQLGVSRIGTRDLAQENTDPGVAHVMVGNDYKILNASKTAALALANVLVAAGGTAIEESHANGDVRFGVGSGTCKVPGKADVRKDVPVDVADAGLVNVPAAGKVVSGEPVDQGVGTRVDADPDNVVVDTGEYGDPEDPLVPAYEPPVSAPDGSFGGSLRKVL